MSERRQAVRVMKIGKPTHYRVFHPELVACGLVGSEYSAWDPRDCNCLNCMKTIRYKEAMQ